MAREHKVADGQNPAYVAKSSPSGAFRQRDLRRPIIEIIGQGAKSIRIGAKLL